MSLTTCVQPACAKKRIQKHKNGKQLVIKKLHKKTKGPYYISTAYQNLEHARKANIKNGQSGSKSSNG
jgi:hypothetical protein